jgi:hypothetical protein
MGNTVWWIILESAGREMGAVGHEQFQKPAEKTQIPKPGGADSGARGAQSDPELAKVVTAWASLPTDCKRQITALVAAGLKRAR